MDDQRTCKLLKFVCSNTLLLSSNPIAVSIINKELSYDCPEFPKTHIP